MEDSIRPEKSAELVEPLKEGRHMEEFAASGRYNFEEFYAARMDTKGITSAIGSAFVSLYFMARKSIDEKRWKKYAFDDYSEYKFNQTTPDISSKTAKFESVINAVREREREGRIKLAADTFRNGGGMGDLDLTLYALDEIVEARIQVIPGSRGYMKKLSKCWYLALRKSLDKRKYNKARRRMIERKRVAQYVDGTMGYEQ